MASSASGSGSFGAALPRPAADSMLRCTAASGVLGRRRRPTRRSRTAGARSRRRSRQRDEMWVCTFPCPRGIVAGRPVAGNHEVRERVPSGRYGLAAQSARSSARGSAWVTAASRLLRLQDVRGAGAVVLCAHRPAVAHQPRPGGAARMRGRAAIGEYVTQLRQRALVAALTPARSSPAADRGARSPATARSPVTACSGSACLSRRDWQRRTATTRRLGRAASSEAPCRHGASSSRYCASRSRSATGPAIAWEQERATPVAGLTAQAGAGSCSYRAMQRPRNLWQALVTASRTVRHRDTATAPSI